MNTFELKQKIKKVLPRSIVKLIAKYHVIQREIMYRGKFKQFGNLNDDKTFYVIRRRPPGGGFFSNFMFVMGHISIANNKGYIPVVDMENYHTFYSEDNVIVNTKNVWEYYYNQPSSYSLKEVYNSKNVCLSSMVFPRKSLITRPNDGKLPSDIEIEKCNEIIRTQIVMKENVLSFVTDKKNDLFSEKLKQSAVGEGILGCLYRGTDYTVNKPYGHSIQPTVEELIEIVRKKRDEWDMEYVYLVTEEEKVVSAFKNAFAEKLICSNSMRHETYEGKSKIPNVRFERENDRYISGLEYLSDIVLLSECDSIVTTITCGAYVALCYNGNKYLHKHIINLGIY